MGKRRNLLFLKDSRRGPLGEHVPCESAPWGEHPRPPCCTRRQDRHGTPLLAPSRALFTPMSVIFLDVFRENQRFREREKTGSPRDCIVCRRKPFVAPMA